MSKLIFNPVIIITRAVVITSIYRYMFIVHSNLVIRPLIDNGGIPPPRFNKGHLTVDWSRLEIVLFLSLVQLS